VNDLPGEVEIFDAPPLGHIESANLTPGQGGKGGTYTDANWVLSICHGIDKEGKSVLIMSSPMFYYFNDQGLADIIAYLKNRTTCGQRSARTHLHLLRQNIDGFRTT